ncbi:MAG: hypothetical protein HUU26_00155 [Gemmatimonadaceae bacterium]|nr:hypothetical protein [Gemmatimonadaceae bacterium]
MRYHYVWLIWSATFLLPWLALYVANANYRRNMWRMSLLTSTLGLTEPVFVPEYWKPPSLFELALRTGFDIESLIFSFAIGGIGAALYTTFTRFEARPVEAAERAHRWHRFHLYALLAPVVSFVPLYLLPWNPIYAAVGALLIGAAGTVLCRPDLARDVLIGGALFLGLYAVFMLGLRWLTPGYIEQVWNLRALTGVLIAGIPLEELLFGLAFGAYWTGLYEHFAWKRIAAP